MIDICKKEYDDDFAVLLTSEVFYSFLEGDYPDRRIHIHKVSLHRGTKFSCQAWASSLVSIFRHVILPNQDIISDEDFPPIYTFKSTKSFDDYDTTGVITIRIVPATQEFLSSANCVF